MMNLHLRYKKYVWLLVGVCYSFILRGQSPGGESTNLQTWFKADAQVFSDNGVTPAVNSATVYRWDDQSTNANMATQVTAGSRPVYVTGALNFNPVVQFSGVHFLYDGAATYGTITNGAKEYFAVMKTATNATNGAVLSIGPNPAVTGNNITYGLNNNTGSGFMATGATSYAIMKALPNSGSVTTPHIYNTTSAASTAAGSWTYNADGLATGTATSSGTNLTPNVTATTVTLGAKFTTTFNSLDAPIAGSIAEVIFYNAQITNRDRILSYLAIKYGITLGTTSSFISYLNSSGTTIWTGDATYQNNVAGIARDDASGLSQKQSKSQNTGLQVVMGNGNTIATDNVSNTNTFSANQSALIWGDDAGAVAAWTTTGAPPSRQIVTRKWKVQETGTVGYVKVQVPDNGGTNGLPAETNTVYLLVDADGNFASGATEYAMTLNGTNWEAPVNFTTGQFFTFATQENSPVNLNLAMTADKTTVSSGQNITYTLTLTNSGMNTATNVQVKDKLPAGVNFVSATPSSGTYNSTTGVWTLPSVAGAAAPTLTIVVTAQ
jgi:uncharacterized repeat protein (TIGR01451 family)